MRRIAEILLGSIASLAPAFAVADLPMVRPETVGLSSERLEHIDALMQAEVDAGRKAGVVTMIVRNGRVAQLKAYGQADIEAGVPMRTDSLFRLYSMTKPVTSVALLMLYEEGKFQLDDPLDRYIPEFADLKVFTGKNARGELETEAPRRKPTIQDVFRHTAGFGYGFGGSPVDEAYAAAGISFGTMTSLGDFVERLATVPLLYHPGDQWVYSVSHDVQAYLVERFSGQPFDDFVRERIFEPLDMQDAVFGVPEAYVSRYTANYAPGENGLTLIETRAGRAPEGIGDESFGVYARYTDVPFGGLSLSSTAMDYAKFAQMLVNGGELDGVRILGSKTVELMRSNHLPPNIPGIGGPSGGGTGYGLGVSVLLDPAQAGNLGSKGQFGWAGAAGTWVTMDPAERMVTMLFAQTLPGDLGLADKLQTLAYQAIVD